MKKSEEKINILVNPNDFGLKSPKKISPITPTKNQKRMLINFDSYGIKSGNIVISEKVLGEGTYSQVFEGTVNDKKIGVKQIKKEWLLLEDIDIIKKEISIHQRLIHQNIIKLEGYEETDSKINIILEKADTSLANKMYRKRIPEDELKPIIKNILNGIYFLHQNNIVHNDVKPQNILIKDNQPKLCDFGHSQIINEKGKIQNNGVMGTFGFIAPEIIKGEDYDSKVDLWSLGVIIFIALGGYYPFPSKNNYVVDSKLVFHENIWKNISNNAVDFIKKSLCFNPNDRMSTLEAINHLWLVL